MAPTQLIYDFNMTVNFLPSAAALIAAPVQNNVSWAALSIAACSLNDIVIK